MRESTHNSEQATAPGPGYYEAPNNPAPCSVTLKRHTSEPRIRKPDTRPGPGDYNLDDSETRHIPGAVISRHGRTEMDLQSRREAMSKPGPGDYTLQSTLRTSGGRYYMHNPEYYRQEPDDDESTAAAFE